MRKNHVKRKMEKKDKILLIIAVVIIIVILVIPLSIKAYINIHSNSKAKMKDSGMEKVMTEIYAVWDRKAKEKRPLTYGDLDKVTTFYTGSWNYYETLSDIEKCKNLERLCINREEGIIANSQINDYNTETVISEDKVKVFCNDLKNILKKDRKINSLIIGGHGEKVENVNFLENGENLRDLSLIELSIDDYSGIGNCKNVCQLSLGKTSVKTADQLKCLQQLDNLSVLSVIKTPLSEDENELKKLQEMLPNVKIYSK